jgi:hypothetical protein
MEEDSGATPCFIAYCECGGWIAVSVDEPDHIKENAEEVANWIRAGFRLEKCTVADVRTGRVQMCECDRRKKKKSRQADLFGGTP